jgi:Rab-like protein 2
MFGTTSADTVDGSVIRDTSSNTVTNLPPADIKIILLGDSAVGKSKLMERFLLDDYIPHTSSTYALSLYRYHYHPSTILQPPSTPHPNALKVDFWDTAGQEQFNSLHGSYYHGAHCCILVFDITRKITYKNLSVWYDELVKHRGIKVISSK